jgi:hypothetical protein
VVVAGLQDPASLTPLLYEYVVQGGQLVIAAGGTFDPAHWNSAAWQSPHRVLPLPLNDQPLGQSADEATSDLKAYYLSLDSLIGEPYFELAGLSRAELANLYGEPLFFKAVEAIESSDGPQVPENIDAAQPSVQWLTWSQAEDTVSETRDASASAAAKAHILARYDLPGRPAFLVSRKIGRGQVLLCTTGLLSPWNTLPKSNAFLVFDRILRGMIAATLPERNFSPQDELTLPLPPPQPGTQIVLKRPGETAGEPLDVTFIGSQTRGATLSGLLNRGLYRVEASRASADAPAAGATPLWEIPLAINGSAAESDLTPLAAAARDQLAASSHLHFADSGQSISAHSVSFRGSRMWRWLVFVALGLLLAEMLVVIVAYYFEGAAAPAGGRLPSAAAFARLSNP